MKNNKKERTKKGSLFYLTGIEKKAGDYLYLDCVKPKSEGAFVKPVVLCCVDDVV